MKNLVIDVISFLKTLTFIDYVLYFAILILIILVASLIYLLKTTNIDEEDFEYDEEFDIKSTVEELSQTKSQNINLTDYEKEQEEKAIISYEELVNTIKKNEINYEEENTPNKDVKIRKIDLDNLDKEYNREPVKVRLMTYEHEEEFLRSLKQLQKLLN